MSQHNDILKHEIAAGIQDGLSPIRIIQRIQNVLDTLEWDEVTVETAPYDAVRIAQWMATQKDGLYGVTHKQLNDFIMNLSTSLPI